MADSTVAAGDVLQPEPDQTLLLNFADTVVADLAQFREEIDALNVYPVPDGDTGTNLYLTLEAARELLQQHLTGDLQPSIAAPPSGVNADEPTWASSEFVAAAAAYSRGALLGARGNSGVILSQIMGAFLNELAAAPAGLTVPQILATALTRATAAGYQAVAEPVEGTMLSVMTALSEAASEAATQQPDSLTGLLHAAETAAQAALERTPQQLLVLAQAGVVDAGGRGLCVVLDSLTRVLTGRARMREEKTRPAIPVVPLLAPEQLSEQGTAYEVMYVLQASDKNVNQLRQELARLGDSLAIVGSEELWNVHVHVDDVGAAIEAGIAAGQLSHIRVTHFADQVARRQAQYGGRRRGLVAVAAGPGLAELFTEAGAVVLRGGPKQRPSTADFLAAIRQTGAHEVVVLPNDPDSLKAAEVAALIAAEDAEANVMVVPTQAQVQGIAAIAVHEPGRPFEVDVVNMAAAAKGARHGAVTVATKHAMTMAGQCEPGDALGVVAGDFAVLGTSLTTVAIEVLSRLIGGGGELVTLVSGVEHQELANECETWLAENHPALDLQIYDGGQSRYPLLMAVE